MSIIKKIIFSLYIIGIFTSLTGCKRVHSKDEIIASMKMYDNYLVQMDTDSLALLYAQNGKLGEVATGRDSIRKFLQTFSNYKVLSNTSTTDSVKIIADTATQVGTYKQVTITPQKDTAHVQGSFHAKWVFYKKEGWKIQKMKTL